MFGLSQIDWALIPYPDIDLQVLVLSIYSADDPAIWEYYKGFVTSPNFQWGVVASESFVVDYEVLTLGPVILVDPDGNIVFRIDHPMPAWQFEKLFELLLQ